MADIVDRATRSRMMSGIRAKNTKPELSVRRYLHKKGFRYRLHVRSLPGAPDLVLPRFHAVILVHGCFWHAHKGCRYAYRPKSNTTFWEKKLAGNVARDHRVRRALTSGGWRVLTVWECATSDEHLDRLADAIRRGLPPPTGPFV
jgi:DNA mismatch endonuclease (patch repair protein)